MAMGKLKMMTATLSVILLCTAFAGAQSLKIKDKAPLTDEKVVDISGKSLTLNEVAESNGLLVIFSCNTCPWVAKWEDRYNGLFQHARENSIGMIALNPNERIRNKGESMEDMKRRADKKEYDFFYALDENHRLADAFGANRTPEVFLFDDELTLVYHGAIDDNANDAADVEQTYVINAIDEMVSGNSVSTAVTKSLGCTIKRIK